MADTPKIPKGRGRSSLSLNKRLKKRLSSPKNCMQDIDNADEVQNSPRVAFNTEAKEFTPPHKKLNLDESLDDSPLSYEGSYSPTTFLSQTYGSDSPDVDWRWTLDEFIGEIATKTDSSFPSKNSSSTMDSHLSRVRSEASRQEYYKKREERRRTKEAKIRKAERARNEAVLRERLAKLESEFKGAHTSKQQPQKDENVMSEVVEKTPATTEYVFDDIDNIFEESNIDFEDPKPATSAKNERVNSLDEFFNDSDTDCLLVEATQQLESEKSEFSQPIKVTSNPQLPTKSINMHETNKEKRSSLYMKFLEDDDDLFVSLDDDWLQKATQSSKPRSPFQRYKSMPTSTTTSSSSSTSKKLCSNLNGVRNDTNTTSTSQSINTIKRHSSSHVMSPSNKNYHGRQLPIRD